MSDDQIKRIISFYLGKSSDEEKRKLDVWVNESAENLAEFKRVIVMCQRLRLALTIDETEKIEKKILKNYQEIQQKQKSRRILYWAASAAAVVLLLSIPFIYDWMGFSEERGYIQQVYRSNAKPGERMAILVVENGDEILLKDNDQRKLNIGSGMVLTRDSIQNELLIEGEMEYPEKKVEYSTLRVPRGGEYNLTLADGTNVWLNSSSELRFPTKFTGNIRQVYLKGEAFFEVKADTANPFVVTLGEADVRVLGTAFNVVNYEDGEQIEVALQNGRVNFALSHSDREQLLTPGKVIRYHKQQRTWQVTHEDVERISAWRTGYFYFENMPLEKLVVKLERWFQVKFTFAEEDLKQMCFTGAVMKYNDLSYALKVIEKTKDISFVQLGEEVKIYRK